MVDLELDDGLAIITIDRPHARNAISLETMDQLEKALDGAEGAAAPSLPGAGDRAFVGGGSATVAAYCLLWAADAHEAGVADLSPAYADAVRARIQELQP